MSPSLTHTEAVATLDITIGNGLPQDSSITLTFPTTWENSVSDTYSPVIYSSTTCSKISGTSLSSSLSCSILSLPSSDQVAIDQAFSSAISASESFSFSLTGILAPATISSNNQITVTTE